MKRINLVLLFMFSLANFVFAQSEKQWTLELGTVLADGSSQYDFSVGYGSKYLSNENVAMLIGGGMELTYNCATNADYADFVMPIFANGRISYSLNNKINLFADLKLGYSFSTCGENDTFKGAGIYLLPQVGIEINRISLGIGYSYQQYGEYEYQQENDSYINLENTHMDGFAIRIGLLLW